MIFGKETRIIYGNDFIKERFLNLTIKIGVTSFFQINLVEAEKAVATIVRDILSSINFSDVLDAYSGIGTIALPVASKGIFTRCIELNEEALAISKENARINNISNIEFIFGGVDNNLSQFLKKDTYLIVDPPRKGLSPFILDTINDSHDII